MSGKESTTTEEYHIDPHPNHDFATTSHGISRVLTSDTHVQLGGMTFHRDEFMRAFEGQLNTGFTQAPTRKFGNPVPLGVASFAVCLFILSLVNVRARGVSNAKGLAALCLCYAGLIELLAGMWCIAVENTWAATLLSSFAGFWISYAGFLLDFGGIVSSYENPKDYHSFMGMFLLAWTILATIMFSLTWRSTWVLSILMLFVVLTFLLLCAAEFTASTDSVTNAANLSKAGGYVGLITSILAFYVSYEGMATRENAYFVSPVLLMPGAVLGPAKKKEESPV